jgi:hypothetical protein
MRVEQELEKMGFTLATRKRPGPSSPWRLRVVRRTGGRCLDQPADTIFPQVFHRKSTEKSPLCTEENALSTGCSLAFHSREAIVSRQDSFSFRRTRRREQSRMRSPGVTCHASRLRALEDMDPGLCLVPDGAFRGKPVPGSCGRLVHDDSRHLPELSRRIHPRGDCRAGSHQSRWPSSG